MKTIKFFFLISLYFFCNAVFAQKEWKTETTENGKITVLSRVVTKLHEGEKKQFIEYKVSTVTSIHLEKLLAVLRDANYHKAFSDDTDESKKLKDLPNGEWLVYYYIDAPFPMPNNDLIVTMKEVRSENTFELIGKSTPHLYEAGDVKRMKDYNLTYKLIELQDGTTQLSMDVSMVPIAKAPDFLVKTWFPEGPSDMIQNILKEAENYDE